MGDERPHSPLWPPRGRSTHSKNRHSRHSRPSPSVLHPPPRGLPPFSPAHRQTRVTDAQTEIHAAPKTRSRPRCVHLQPLSTLFSSSTALQSKDRQLTLSEKHACRQAGHRNATHCQNTQQTCPTTLRPASLTLLLFAARSDASSAALHDVQGLSARKQ